MNRNEECWVLTGKRKGTFWQCAMHEPTTGSPCEVSFDFDWVLKRDANVGDVAGFVHTHPSGLLEPSSKDISTMRAWVSCFGRPLLCGIACTDQVRVFLFEDDHCEGIVLAAAMFHEPRFLLVCDRRLASIGVG